MSEIINKRMVAYINHKSSTLFERVKLAILDKIFDAENYDEYDIDEDNNINIQYSLKRDENIISDSHDIIQEKIRINYRKRIEDLFVESGYFIEYDNSDIKVFFTKPLMIKKQKYEEDSNDNLSHISLIEENNNVGYKTDIVIKDNLELFDFGDDQ